MYTSEGGGYCDCGDEEAFLQYHVCNVHKEKKKDHGSTDLKDSQDSLPIDMQVRTKRLFIEILRYIFEVTTPKNRKIDDFAVGGKDKEMWPELKDTFEFANKSLLLINDNFHTYTDVTKVVKKSLNCNQKMAHDVTEFVDKDGRAIVFVGRYEDCAPIRDKIELHSRRDGRSLKCDIIPTSIIAHQLFAVRLLTWLYELLKKHSGFRTIFVDVAQSKEKDVDFRTVCPHFPLLQDLTICEAILVHDAKWWKRVRKSWFNVVIEGIMKDYEAKKVLAQNYVKHYRTIMTDFVTDDQETDISITNISVQIFTVPTIAHDLVEFHNSFHVMAEYFLSELNDQKSDGGQLMLEEWMEDPHNMFDRVHHVLLDMQYLLSKPPSMTDTWSEKMKQTFFEGVQSFLKILEAYQGIDPHRRETHQHVEFESLEWESVYKLTEPTWQIAEKVMEWSKTDKSVFMKVLERALKMAHADFEHRFSKYDSIESKVEFEEVINKTGSNESLDLSYSMIDIDVGRELVSANIPLQRFLGGLIPCIEELNLKRSLDRIRETATNFPSIIDPVITTLTMLSQAACHLWRRNGNALDGISFIYHQFLPRLKQNDLVMLQLAVAMSDDMGATLAQTLLHRFRLTKWGNGEFDEGEVSEDEIIKTLNMADEFLKIILALLSERFTYMVGKVSKKDDLRYHVAHMLCTGPLSHSEIISIMRHRIRDGSEGELEEVIKEVGCFKQSKKDPNKRVFELKDEYRRLYNPCYYYYSREQGSAALVAQAEHLRLNDNKTVDCLIPPKMPTLTAVFSNLPNLAASFPILKIIDSILGRFIPTNKKFYGTKTDLEKIKMQENSIKHLQKALFIILIGCEDDLDRCTAEMSNYNGFMKAAQRLNFRDKLSKIQFLSTSADATDVKLLLEFTVTKFDNASTTVLKTTKSETEESAHSRARKTSEDASGSSESSDNEARKRRAEAAKIHRAKIMAQMNKMQKQFMDKNVVEMMDTDTASDAAASAMDVDMEESQSMNKRIATGKTKTKPHYENQKVTCILCQEEQLSWGEENKEVLVMASYVTKSAILSRFDTSVEKDSNSICSNTQTPSRFGCSPSVSSCGHFMHAKCYQKFFESLVTKTRDNIFRQILNYDVERQEYLCPICERLCNNVLPVIPPVTSYLKTTSSPNSDFSKWLTATKDILSQKYLDEPDGGASSAFPHLIEDIIRLVLKKPTLALKDTPSFPKLPEQFRNMTTAFANNTYSKSLNAFPSEEDAKMIHLNLQSLIVSLHLSQCGADDVVDQILHHTKRQKMDTLRALVRVCLMLPFTLCHKASNPLMKCLRSNAIYILSVLLKSDIKDKSFNDFDAFGLLVFCIVSYPALTYPDRDANFSIGKEDQNILVLCYVAHIVQILINYPISSLEQLPMEKFGLKAQDDKAIRQLTQKISSYLGVEYITKTQQISKKDENGSKDTISNILKKKSLRFLRCASLFFHFYTDIPLPEGKPGKENSLETSYEALTSYLGLPNTFSKLIETPGVAEVIER